MAITGNLPLVIQTTMKMLPAGISLRSKQRPSARSSGSLYPAFLCLVIKESVPPVLFLDWVRCLPPSQSAKRFCADPAEKKYTLLKRVNPLLYPARAGIYRIRPAIWIHSFHLLIWAHQATPPSLQIYSTCSRTRLILLSATKQYL